MDKNDENKNNSNKICLRKPASKTSLVEFLIKTRVYRVLTAVPLKVWLSAQNILCPTSFFIVSFKFL